MIFNPEKENKKLAEYLNTDEYKKVLVVFWHGLGDIVQFLNVFDKLKELYPNIHFDLGLQKGLSQEVIFPEAILLENLNTIEEGYDLTALIHFPVETDPSLTKSELCCRDELGIEMVVGHKELPKFQSKLVAVHFNLTCLPELANPDRDTAEKIWNEIIEAGYIPIESHFEHVFHNPKNKKFDFVDCTVRRCRPQMSSLLGLLGACNVFVGVVSGNFHCAMSVMPHNRICYLEKDIPVSRFTKEKIKTVDIKEYKDGQVFKWLKSIHHKEVK